MVIKTKCNHCRKEIIDTPLKMVVYVGYKRVPYCIFCLHEIHQWSMLIEAESKTEIMKFVERLVKKE